MLGTDGGLQPPNPCGVRLLCHCAPEPLQGGAILGCAPEPLQGGDGLRQHGVIAHDELAEILAGEGDCFGEGGIGFQGFGGGAPVRSPLPRPKDFCRIHQPVRGPQRAEGGILRIIHNQEEMHMIGHDHEIGNGGAWEAAMHCHQQLFHNLAAGQQRRARALINEARKAPLRGASRGTDGGCAPEPLRGGIGLGMPFNGYCDEEELPAGMMELHFHVQVILSEKRLRYKSAA